MTKFEDYFYHTETSNRGTYFYWSKDWFSLRPWTFDRNPVNYFDVRITENEKGKMTVRFFGPLCVITFVVATGYEFRKENA